MMGSVLDADESEFGVVLIERGSEVGGGDQRFDVGTTAQVLQVEAPEGPLQVVARGGRRFRVTKWLEEEPFPRAEVEFLEVFDPADVPGEELMLTENVVRETLEYLAELDLSLPWPTDIELATDPVEKAWQLAGISPLGTLDHQDLLVLDNPVMLVERTRVIVTEALETFRKSRNSGE